MSIFACLPCNRQRSDWNRHHEVGFQLQVYIMLSSRRAFLCGYEALWPEDSVHKSDVEHRLRWDVKPDSIVSVNPQVSTLGYSTLFSFTLWCTISRVEYLRIAGTVCSPWMQCADHTIAEKCIGCRRIIYKWVTPTSFAQTVHQRYHVQLSAVEAWLLRSQLLQVPCWPPFYSGCQRRVLWSTHSPGQELHHLGHLPLRHPLARPHRCLDAPWSNPASTWIYLFHPRPWGFPGASTPLPRALAVMLPISQSQLDIDRVLLSWNLYS